MAYRDFSLSDLNTQFGVVNRRKRLFEKVEPVLPSEKLMTELEEVDQLPIRSEKAKSEWIVVPILKELWHKNDKFFTIYSGDTLVGDEQSGLKGECDFILAKDIGSYDINYPIIQILEAKKNDIELGVPQCAAQLVGARLFNQKKGVELSAIYGCVTTGNSWLFMRLGEQLHIDTKVYNLENIQDILGVFQVIIEGYKKELGK
jgi:hypothetical protein